MTLKWKGTRGELGHEDVGDESEEINHNKALMKVPAGKLLHSTIA